MHEKKRRPLRKKTLIVTLIAAAAVIAAAAAVIIIKNATGDAVNVYSVSNLSTGYWGGELYTYGTVTTDKI